MTEFIQNIFSSIFGNNVILATIIIAMVPIIELKGAIPFSMSSAIWKGYQLTFSQAFLWSLLGSSLVVPILVLIYKPIINFLKNTKLFRKLALKIENKVNSKKQVVEEKIEKQNNENDLKQSDINLSKGIYKETTDINDKKEDVNKKQNKSLIVKLISVFVFVAIPLPFTGVWTGSCLAVALGLNFGLSCVCVICGNVVAGILVTFFSSAFSSPLTFLYIFVFLIIIFALFYLIKKIVCLKLNRKTQNNDYSIDKKNKN